jgi:hypothetical protein
MVGDLHPAVGAEISAANEESAARLFSSMSGVAHARSCRRGTGFACGTSRGGWAIYGVNSPAAASSSLATTKLTRVSIGPLSHRTSMCFLWVCHRAWVWLAVMPDAGRVLQGDLPDQVRLPRL